jgi:Tol biopolymer transport system component
MSARTVTCLAATFVLLLSASAPAQAAFPGINGRIVFHHVDGADDIYDSDLSDIFSISSTGAGLVQLTNHPAGDQGPAVSPDGKKIAFESERSGGYDIYVMNADGSGLVRLTNDPAFDGSASWSPDGTKIAFSSYRDGNHELYVMNADGSAEERVTYHPAADAAPAWSPTGSTLAFTSSRSGNWDIYSMKLCRCWSPIVQLTDDPGDDMAPTWSPDGSKIAFETERNEVGNNHHREIYMVNDGGGNEARVTFNAADDFSPAWSPDGTKIVFSRSGDLYTTAANSSPVKVETQVTSNTENNMSDVTPDWARLTWVSLPPLGP